jgi:hypothetical protein
VDGVQYLHALDFNEDSIPHDQIGPMLPNYPTLVEHGHSNLAGVRHAGVSKLDAEGFFVRRVQQTWTEMSMHFDRASNDSMSQ